MEKLRLLVTTKCPNKCPMCCNNSMESKSLRLNLFPDIKKHIPDNTDLSLWKVKDMQWIKDCPVPADEEFKRVAELWEVE